VEQERKERGLNAKLPFFFLSGAGHTGVVGRRWAAALLGTAAAGSGGNGERRSRATHSGPHLGLG
jgi:hypothetical protein